MGGVDGFRAQHSVTLRILEADDELRLLPGLHHTARYHQIRSQPFGSIGRGSDLFGLHFVGRHHYHQRASRTFQARQFTDHHVPQAVNKGLVLWISADVAKRQNREALLGRERPAVKAAQDV